MPTNIAKTKLEASLSQYYGEDFYKSQMAESFKSAQQYVEFLISIYKPKSIVDVGCGRGTWLKAFKDKGIEKVVGFDGHWNNQESMVDPSIMFHSMDLNEPLAATYKNRYDLAISLEVAEHLNESSAQTFIETLTQLSEVILFSAAYIEQGGTHHINEQPHTYWANIFRSYDYVPYDLFRPHFWGNNDVGFWYQQNIFLYVQQNSPVTTLLSDAGYHPIKNIHFMNCIHPCLYHAKLSHNCMKQLLIKMIPKPMLPLARKIKKIFF